MDLNTRVMARRMVFGKLSYYKIAVAAILL